MANRLNALWTKPVIVDNRGGANGTIAADIAVTPEQLSRHMRAEIERWGKVIRDAGVKTQG